MWPDDLERPEEYVPGSLRYEYIGYGRWNFVSSTPSSHPDYSEAVVMDACKAMASLLAEMAAKRYIKEQLELQKNKQTDNQNG